MTNRVVLGKRGANYGLWVSKPGKDVLSATAAGMLFTMDLQALQPAIDSLFSASGGADGYATITHPSLGFFGYAYLDSGDYFITGQTATTVTFYIGENVTRNVRLTILNLSRT